MKFYDGSDDEGTLRMIVSRVPREARQIEDEELSAESSVEEVAALPEITLDQATLKRVGVPGLRDSARVRKNFGKFCGTEKFKSFVQEQLGN